MKIQSITTILSLSLLIPIASNAASRITKDSIRSVENQTLSSDFSAGYRAGYKKANPTGLCPIPPIPPIGQNTYGDGYGMGYARGLADKG